MIFVDGRVQLGSTELLSKRYNSAVCCSKMSCDAFASEVLYEADKALKKFAFKVCCSAAGV